ncbi:MAG: hypothetical protein ACTSR8_16550 [Promethearchaeota archaeon]
MLLLIYFNRIIGPSVYLVEPDTLLEDLGEVYIDQIRGIMDTADLGFSSHYFSKDLQTANYVFKINSTWARGRNELVMITSILSEDEPDLNQYEKRFKRFAEKLQDNPNLFKAFYINNIPPEEKEAVQKTFATLESEFKDLYKILSIKKIETEGKLYSFFKLKNQKQLPLSSNVITRLMDLMEKENKDNCFIVYRTRGEAMKIDIIPVDTEKIIRLVIIFGEKMTVSILQRISEILANHNEKLKLVFTSGICQELDRCIYEVYIDTEIEILNQIIEDIYKIPEILEMEVKLIGINS